MSEIVIPTTLESFVALLETAKVTITETGEGRDRHCFVTIDGIPIDIRVGTHNLNWKVGLYPNNFSMVTTVLPKLITVFGLPKLMARQIGSDVPIQILWGETSVFVEKFTTVTYHHYDPDSDEYIAYLKKWGIEV